MGKERWIKTVSEHSVLMDGFNGFGKDTTQVGPATEAAYASLVSILYSGRGEASMDTVRYDSFLHHQKPF